MSEKKGRRLLRNYLVNPPAQLRLSFHFLSFVLLVTGLLLIFIFGSMSTYVHRIVGEGAEPVLVAQTLARYINFVQWLTAGVMFIMSAFSFVLSIIVSHRMVGPMVAIHRQLRFLLEGDYDKRVRLRKDDAFQDVAHDLNKLTEQLSAQEQGQ